MVSLRLQWFVGGNHEKNTNKCQKIFSYFFEFWMKIDFRAVFVHLFCLWIVILIESSIFHIVLQFAMKDYFLVGDWFSNMSEFNFNIKGPSESVFKVPTLPSRYRKTCNNTQSTYNNESTENTYNVFKKVEERFEVLKKICPPVCVACTIRCNLLYELLKSLIPVYIAGRRYKNS